jgi:hypothetical protein
MERRNGPQSSFRGFPPPPARYGWFPRGGSFGRCETWLVLTQLWSNWLGTGFSLLALTPVLSRLFTHLNAFEFQVGAFV